MATWYLHAKPLVVEMCNCAEELMKEYYFNPETFSFGKIYT